MYIANLFAVLRIRNFRLLWASSFMHVIGEVSELIAQAWLVLLLTDDSALWLGIAAGLRGLGHIGIGLLGGVFADRLDRRTILIFTKFIRSLTIVILVPLIIFEEVQLWHVLLIVLLQGASEGFFVPSFNGIIYDIVGRKDLMKANGYTLASFHTAWIVGSILAGNFINSIGIELAYILASVSLFISIFPIYLIRVPRTQNHSTGSVWSSILLGFKYVGTNTPLKALLILSVLTETFGFSYIMMLPLIAKSYLDVGATGLGYLSAAGGIGSLLGTAIVVTISETKNKWTILTITTLIAAFSLFLFGNSSWYILSLIIAGIIGLSLTTYDASIHTLIQLLSEDKMRGRVLGLYGMTWGFTPAGGLLLGLIASITSAPFAIGLGGVVIFIYTGGVIFRVGKKTNLPN